MPLLEDITLFSAGGFLSILDVTLDREGPIRICGDLSNESKLLCRSEAQLFYDAYPKLHHLNEQ